MRLGDAVAFAQIGIVGLDGQIELEALRLYGLPEAASALLRGTPTLPRRVRGGRQPSFNVAGEPARATGTGLGCSERLAMRRGGGQQPREFSMDLHPSLQRAFDRVELVSGTIGDPGEGRMCLMSLVAFLAGEPHSDAPGCASPLIQTFAVVVNNHMPHEARQRLKPFAPRIIGTNDGFNSVRAAVLRHALAEGILARAPDECLTGSAAAPARGRFSRLRRLWRWLRKDEQGRLLALSGDDGVNLAREAERLIARSARRAADAREQERHWDAAIGLLGQAVRRGRAEAARTRGAGRAPGAAREHAPLAPGRAHTRGAHRLPTPVRRTGDLGRSGATTSRRTGRCDQARWRRGAE